MGAAISPELGVDEAAAGGRAGGGGVAGDAEKTREGAHAGRGLSAGGRGAATYRRSAAPARFAPAAVRDRLASSRFMVSFVALEYIKSLIVFNSRGTRP